MNRLLVARAFVAFVAAAAPTGCGGAQGVPQAVVQAAEPAVRAHVSAHKRSWMLPEATSDTLLYYTTGEDEVVALSYPQGKVVGTLTGFDLANGVCTDGNGNVFVTTQYTEAIYEYAHGGTQQLAKLEDYGYYPYGCAVDPVTGNLAVANTEAMNGGSGNVAIYTGAKGKPSFYTAYGVYGYNYPAYDANGNLYVNASSLAEMPYGSQSMSKISLDVYGGGIQWDGQYLAMINGTDKQVYRIAISGSSGTVVSTVSFTGLFTKLGEDFVLPSTGGIVVPYGSEGFKSGRIGQFAYPKGGTLKKKIHKAEFVQAMALSI